MDITQFRQKYPQYDHVDDQALATKLHERHYSHVDYETFAGKFGVSSQPIEQPVQEVQPAKPAKPVQQQPLTISQPAFDNGLTEQRPIGDNQVTLQPEGFGQMAVPGQTPPTITQPTFSTPSIPSVVSPQDFSQGLNNFTDKIGEQSQPQTEQSRMGLPERAGKQFANRAVLQDIEQARPSTGTLESVGVMQSALEDADLVTDPTIWQGIKSIPKLWWAITKSYYSPTKKEERAVAHDMLKKHRGSFDFDVPPPETVGEKAVDVGAGLAAFITRLYVARKVVPKEIGSLREALVWEMESRASGGIPGEGAAMAGTLGMLGKLKQTGKISTAGMLGGESALFSSLAASQGAELEDIIIAALIPPVMRGIGFRKRAKERMGAANNEAELKQVTEEIRQDIESAKAYKEKNGRFPDWVLKKYQGVEAKAQKLLPEPSPEPLKPEISTTEPVITPKAPEAVQEVVKAEAIKPEIEPVKQPDQAPAPTVKPVAPVIEPSKPATTGKTAGKHEFNTRTTDMSFYDDIIRNPEYQKENKGREGRIVNMSPDEYLNKVAEGFWQNPSNKKRFSTFKEFKEWLIKSRSDSTETIQKYISRWEKGEKPPMPVLEYGEEGHFSQEGIHRAIMAKQVGVESMPVFEAYIDNIGIPAKAGEKAGKLYETIISDEFKEKQLSNDNIWLHGSNQDNFSLDGSGGNYGSLLFVTKNPQVAGGFGKGKAGVRVLKLSKSNLFDVRDSDLVDEVASYYVNRIDKHQNNDVVVDMIEENGIDGSIKKIADEMIDVDIVKNGNLFEDEDVVDWLISKGYDGIKDNRTDSAIIFNPDNIADITDSFNKTAIPTDVGETAEGVGPKGAIEPPQEFIDKAVKISNQQNSPVYISKTKAGKWTVTKSKPVGRDVTTVEPEKPGPVRAEPTKPAIEQKPIKEQLAEFDEKQKETTEPPDKDFFVKRKAGGGTPIISEAAEELVEVAKGYAGDTGSIASSVKRGVRSTLSKGTSIIGRLGEGGKKLSGDIKNLTFKIIKKSNTDVDDVDQIVKTTPRKARTKITQYMNGYITDVPQIIKDKAKALTEIYDRAMIARNEQGGLRQLRSGEKVPVTGKGEAYPQTPNAAGVKIQNLAHKAGKNSKKVMAVAEKMVAKGFAETTDKAIKNLQALREFRLRGVNAYLEGVRKKMLAEHIEWDFNITKDTTFQRNWMTVEGANKWGLEHEKVATELETIREEYGEADYQAVRDFIAVSFGKSSGVDLSHEQASQAIRSYQFFTKVATSPPTMVRNVLDRYPKGVTVGGPLANIKATLAYPPILNPLFKKSRELERAMFRAGLLTGHGGITEGVRPGTRAGKALSTVFKNTEIGNQTYITLVRYFQLLQDMKRLQKADANGVNRVFDKINSIVGNSIEQTKKRTGDLIKLSNDELFDKIDRSKIIDNEMVGEMLHRTMTDRTFPILMSTKPIWWDKHPFFRVLAQFKTWPIRQTAHVYNDIVKHALPKKLGGQGDISRMVRWMVSLITAGEIWNLMNDWLKNRDESITSKVRNKEYDEIMKAALNNFVDGGGIGIAYDLTYGLFDWFTGVTPSTGKKVVRSFIDVGKNPKMAPEIAVDLIKKEVAPARQLDQIYNNIFKNDGSFVKEYYSIRSDTYKFKGEDDGLEKLVDRTIYGFRSYERTERTFAYQEAARSITIGDRKGAIKALRSIIDKAENRKKAVKDIEGQIEGKSPLGPINKKEYPKYLNTLSPERRMVTIKTNDDWIRSYKSALNAAKFK